METLEFTYTAQAKAKGRAHVGVVGSGDLEVLLEPIDSSISQVRVRTSVPGFSRQWKAVLERFFLNYNAAVRIEINDAGATPGVVALRLAQAAEASDQ